MAIVPNVFKIDKAHHALKDLKDTTSIIETIISRSLKKKNNPYDDNLLIRNFRKGSVIYYLYHYQVHNQDSEWSNFLPQELKDRSDFLQTKVNLVLFIQTENELFALVGGSAYWIIASYIDHLYGLTTYDKIISPEDDEAILTKSRGMTGHRAGLSEQFRNEYRIMNYLQFGKVPKVLHIKLANQTSIEHFSYLMSKDTDRIQIAAGKGLRINKEVDFEKLHLVILELDLIKTLAPQDYISSYLYISDQADISALKDKLIKKIYNNIPYVLKNSQDPNDIFEFDFCNPNNIEAFYEADKYCLTEKVNDSNHRFATVRDKDDIYKRVVERAYQTHGGNLRAIQKYLYGVNVQCYIGKRQVTSSGFMYHFNAEFSLRNDAVFLIDTKWYRLKKSIIETLASQTKKIFKTSQLQEGIVDKQWVFDSLKKRFYNEGSYNMLYDQRPNYIVFDTVTVDGIELCDVLHITDDKIYLIHVKHSFTAKVRELTNQILISARLLSQVISGQDRSYFEKLYNALVEKKRYLNNFTKEQFFDIFQTKTPVYVFATASQLKEDLPIADNIEKYNSNIARFSLVTCSSEMQTTYFEFKTCQIWRDTLPLP